MRMGVSELLLLELWIIILLQLYACLTMLKLTKNRMCASIRWTCFDRELNLCEHIVDFMILIFVLLKIWSMVTWYFHFS